MRKTDAPIIMRSFSISRPVLVVELSDFQPIEPKGQLGVSAVQLVSWSEQHGNKETLISEQWKEVLPNMYVSTSLRK